MGGAEAVVEGWRAVIAAGDRATGILASVRVWDQDTVLCECAVVASATDDEAACIQTLVDVFGDRAFVLARFGSEQTTTEALRAQGFTHYYDGALHTLEDER